MFVIEIKINKDNWQVLPYKFESEDKARGWMMMSGDARQARIIPDPEKKDSIPQ